MRMQPSLSILLAVLLLVATGCATTGPSGTTSAERSANDTPRQFAVASSTSVTGMSDDLPSEGCANPLIDPRDGTELRLKRSIMGKGDYDVPDGKYGVGPNELLRVDCSSGQPLKIVKR